MYQDIEYRLDKHVAIITLNRPDRLNAWTGQMEKDIRAAMEAAAADSNVRAIVVTGAGRGFCAGADLAGSGFANDAGRSTGEQTAHSMLIGYNPFAADLAAFPKPVVVAVNGVCAGGGVGLALAGDIVIAGKSAYFVQVFGPKLGLVPDVGVTWYAPRLVGRARARGLALLGDRLPAEKAAAWGLIWDAVDDDKLLDEARAIASRLAKGPRKGFMKIKEVLDASLDNSLQAQLDLERVTQGELGDHPDFIEGVTAFLQKRDPVFA